MRNATGGIAVGLIQDAQRKKQVVQTEQDEAPRDKRHIKPAQTTDNERLLIVHVSQFEEIACADEKEGHVEEVDEARTIAGEAGMAQHDKDDAYALADGKRTITHNCRQVEDEF